MSCPTQHEFGARAAQLLLETQLVAFTIVLV